MPRPILVFWMSSALLAAPAFPQQTGNPAGASPDTPNVENAAPPPTHPNQPDMLFARQAVLGNRVEVDLGRLAARQAQSQAVKDFAKQMVDDHSRSGDKLAALARANDIPLRKDIDGEHKAKQAELSKLQGAAFDAAYIQAQVQEHQKTALLLQHHISAGQDVRLKKYSMETLPTVLHHLEMAKNIQSQLAGSTPRN